MEGAARGTSATVDMHSTREQDLCTLVYAVDREEGEPIAEQEPVKSIGVFLGHVLESNYRRNARNERGTKTATFDAKRLAKYRRSWVYMTNELRCSQWCKRNFGLTLLS